MRRVKTCIRGGSIWDGSRFRTGDIAVEDGKIAALGDADGFQADFIYDATDKLVVPGLVDLHMHVRGVSLDVYGAQPESSCFPFGVTASADCGASQGDRMLLDQMMLKCVVFVTVDIEDNRARIEQAERLIEQYGDLAIGVKAYYDTSVCSVRDIRPLEDIVRFAREKGLKTMVHCNHSPVPMVQIVRTLQKGDILTHIYHGGEYTAAQDGYRALQEAKARGVVLDAGLAGNVHTNVALLRDALSRGFQPDVLSTDLTRLSVYTRAGVYGLPLCMTLFEDLGVEQETVLRMVTTSAADALNQTQWGRLAVGGAADIAVLDRLGQPYELVDSEGNRVQGKHTYRCCLTLSDGEIVYRAG